MSDNVVYINAEEGISRVMNNAKLFSKLLGKFKSDLSLTEIEAAFAQGAIDNAKNSAHTLKGLAANLSLIELFKQVLELETQIKGGAMNIEQLALVKDVYANTLIEADKVIEKYAG